MQVEDNVSQKVVEQQYKTSTNLLKSFEMTQKMMQENEEQQRCNEKDDEWY